MKTLMRRWVGGKNWQLVATFGQAQLVRTLEGRWELRGGSPADRGAAREWISLFMHEAVPALLPGERRWGSVPA